jgi:hypothetical protein
VLNLSRCLLEEGRCGEADSALREALEIAEPALVNDHPTIALGRIYLARFRLAQREPAQAESLARDALRIGQRLYPSDDWRVAVPKSVLGAALTALGCTTRLARCFSKRSGFRRTSPASRSRRARATRARLAALEDARGRPHTATLEK